MPPALRLAWAGPRLNGIALVAGLASEVALSGPAPGQPQPGPPLAGFLGAVFWGGVFWAVPFGRFLLGSGFGSDFGSGLFPASLLGLFLFFRFWESLFFRVWLPRVFGRDRNGLAFGAQAGPVQARSPVSASFPGFGFLPAQGAAISLWGAGGVGRAAFGFLAHVP